MKALILAAGKGTRLGALTADCPKPLLDLDGRPIIDCLIESLRDDAGIREFVIITGHLAEKMEAHLGDGARLGVTIQCRRQENPQGTGEAVHMARDLLDGDEPFLMTYGDIVISPENYSAIVADFNARQCDLLLSLNWVEDPAAGGAIYIDDDHRVTRVVEKPPPGTSTTNWNSAGLMIFRPVIFEHTARLQPSPRGEYELTDAVTSMIAEGCNVRGFPLTGLWSDIGTPEDLERTRAVMRGGVETSARRSE